MTFLAFRPFRRRKHRNDVIVTSYIKILQILKLKSKDITSKTLHAKFYASRIKNKRIRRGGKIRPPQVWSVFKSPGKIGLMNLDIRSHRTEMFHKVANVSFVLLFLIISIGVIRFWSENNRLCQLHTLQLVICQKNFQSSV